MADLLNCPLCGKPPTLETFNHWNERLNFQDSAGWIDCESCNLRLESPCSGDICGMQSYAELDEKWDPSLCRDWLIAKWNTRHG